MTTSRCRASSRPTTRSATITGGHGTKSQGHASGDDSPKVSGAGSTGVSELAAQLSDLVSEASGVFELELGARLVHFLFERLDQARQFLLWQRLELALHLVALTLAAAVLAGYGRRVVGPQQRQDVADRLADRLRIDAVLGVVGDLELPPAL